MGIGHLFTRPAIHRQCRQHRDRRERELQSQPDLVPSNRKIGQLQKHGARDRDERDDQTRHQLLEETIRPRQNNDARHPGEGERPVLRSQKRKNRVDRLARAPVDPSSDELSKNDPQEPEVDVPRDFLAAEGGQFSRQTVEGVQKRSPRADGEPGQFSLDNVLAPATRQNEPQHRELDD